MVKYSIKIMLCVALAAILGLLPTPLCAQSKSKSGKDSSQTISPEEKARIEEQRRIIKELEQRIEQDE
jgi:hypothetical protein